MPANSLNGSSLGITLKEKNLSIPISSTIVFETGSIVTFVEASSNDNCKSKKEMIIFFILYFPIYLKIE